MNTGYLFIYLCLYFLSSMFYNVQCIDIWPPWFNLFLSILFFWIFYKWDCFLNFLESSLLVYRNTVEFVCWLLYSISSVKFSRSVMSDSLRPHELQHARPPCPSPTPRVYSNSCPSSRWCHPAFPSSVVPFSSCPSSFPASGSFQMS